MGLRDKYAYAIQQAKGKFDGSAQERDGKLYFTGSVKTEAEKNELWSAIKTIPEWRDEIVADIKVTGGPAAAEPAGRTYTVKSGDTLSAIARQHLGDANAGGLVPSRPGMRKIGVSATPGCYTHPRN